MCDVNVLHIGQKYKLHAAQCFRHFCGSAKPSATLSYGFALLHIGHFFSYSMTGRRASDLIPFHRYVLTTQLTSFVYA